MPLLGEPLHFQHFQQPPFLKAESLRKRFGGDRGPAFFHRVVTGARCRGGALLMGSTARAHRLLCGALLHPAPACVHGFGHFRMRRGRIEGQQACI